MRPVAAVHMQFRVHTRVAQRLIKRQHRVNRDHLIASGVEDECRRRLARNRTCFSHARFALDCHLGRSVAQQQKIRPRAHAVHRISRGGSARLGMRGNRDRQMPAGGETHHADMLRIDAVVTGMRPHPAHGALAVEQGDLRRVALGLQPIGEHERRHAHLRQPVRRLQAFVIDHQHVVAAARTDDHRGAVRLLRFRPVHAHPRPVPRLVALGLRRAGRPQFHSFGLQRAHTVAPLRCVTRIRTCRPHGVPDQAQPRARGRQPPSAGCIHFALTG